MHVDPLLDKKQHTTDALISQPVFTVEANWFNVTKTTWTTSGCTYRYTPPTVVCFQSVFYFSIPFKYFVMKLAYRKHFRFNLMFGMDEVYFHGKYKNSQCDYELDLSEMWCPQSHRDQAVHSEAESTTTNKNLLLPHFVIQYGALWNS